MTIIEHVDMGLPASFVWDYHDRRPRLSRLYEKSKVSQWNASTDLDWSIEVDPGTLPEVAGLAAVDWGADGPLDALVKEHPELLGDVVANMHAWLVSQFMHGEQGALVATAKIGAAAESIDDKYYAAAQVADEARHVEAYQRYLDKIEMEYPISGPLHELLSDVMRHRHVDLTFLGMQILVEGVALAAFSLGGFFLANPLIARITELVRRDEARHVAFGVLSLQGHYDDMDPIDLAEREEFLLEACALMRDRFVPTQVWERFGIDAATASKAFANSPDMVAFRSLMFSKVVPNLRKLGLLTPRVREGFEQLGILRYERYVDSATEAGELEPGDGAADNGEAGREDPLAAMRVALATVEHIPPEPVLMVLAGLTDSRGMAEAPPATVRLLVSGVDAGDWLLDIGPAGLSYRPDDPASPADVELSTDIGTWSDIVAARSTPPEALFKGKVT
ncbi:MAG: ferritin-like domain-containing protein, partial [Acidimicrobiales bacterium]